MALTLIGEDLFRDLVFQAQVAPRRRQHFNLHSNYADPCQRLLNAICFDSYIRPHCHRLDPKDELLVVLSGEVVCWRFDDSGRIASTQLLSSGGTVSAVMLSAYEWHTVTALSEAAIILEVKAGPFDASVAKSFAPWAPEEGTPDAERYLAQLRASFRR